MRFYIETLSETCYVDNKLDNQSTEGTCSVTQTFRTFSLREPRSPRRWFTSREKRPGIKKSGHLIPIHYRRVSREWETVQCITTRDFKSDNIQPWKLPFKNSFVMHYCFFLGPETTVSTVVLKDKMWHWGQFNERVSLEVKKVEVPSLFL